MNNPIQKIDQPPEGYSPKDRPEILSMMEERTSTMSKSCEVKTANGGSYIDGVPMLKWGEWRDSSYCGCVAALLNAAGIPVTYEEVMGLSGVCYQAIMCHDWDPSSQMPQNGKLCEKNVGDALGVDVYMLSDEMEIWEQAKKSINGGIPVLLVAGKWAPEWTLACGYEIVNGVPKFFGRTYFDTQAPQKDGILEGQPTRVPENEIYTENKYFFFNAFPGWVPGALTRFYDRKCEPISRKQALKVSLETCIMMFEQTQGEHHGLGYGAYDILISGFELGDDEYLSKCNCAQYHIGSMQDARRAAYTYLSVNAALLDGENREKLAETAEIYRKMLDNLLTAVPYEETSPVFNGEVAAHDWDRQQRQEIAAALRENKDLERQARVIVADILKNWD